MTNHRTTDPSRSGRWLRLGTAVFLIAAVLPGAMGAVRRNWAYLHLLHGDVGVGTDGAVPASGGTRADDLLVLRRSLQRGDWITTERMLARTSGPDRLAPLIVLHEAGWRVNARDLDGARAALGIVSAQADGDSVVWYRLGEAYERTNSPEDAVQAYARGAASDPVAPWTEGRYRIAMIYQREEKWQPLADLLGPLLGTASDEDLGRTIQSLQSGGALWQGTFLALGQAYDHLGKVAEAEATYERIARIAAPRRDWTLNRALVYLARAKRAHGDFVSALEAVMRALDLATEFDASFRREYELDTAAEADRVIDQAHREGQLDTLQTSVDDLVRRAPQSPGSWYLRGLASEAACDLGRARPAYERAASLVRPGAGAFLAARPVDPARGPCPPR